MLWSLRPKELGKLLRTIGVGGAQAKTMQRAVAAERAKVEAAHAAEAQAAQGTEAASDSDGDDDVDSIGLSELLEAGCDEDFAPASEPSRRGSLGPVDDADADAQLARAMNESVQFAKAKASASASGPPQHF